MKYFVEVSRLKSFSQASKSLFITQSTLSQQIQRLEDELGIELLTRDTRHVALSDYGLQFLPHAERILQEAQASVDAIKDVKNLEVGTLAIGYTYSFATVLRQTVIDFHRRHPRIKLQFTSASKEELMHQLVDRQLDLALSYKSVAVDERIESRKLFTNRLCLIARKGALPDGLSAVAPEALEAYPLVLPSKGLQARDTLDLILSMNNLKLDIQIEINSLHGILNLVKNGRMFTILSGEAVSRLDGFVAVPISHPDGLMEGCYHYLKGAYHKRAARIFVDALTENNAFNESLRGV